MSQVKPRNSRSQNRKNPNATVTSSQNKSRKSEGDENSSVRPKRALSLASPESIEIDKASKKPRNITTTDMDELKHLIADKIEATKTSVESKITDLSNKVDQDINSLKTSVEDFKTKVSNELTHVKTQLVIHNQRIDNTEDDIQRLTRNQDLRLTGFPAKDNENLVNYVLLIAKEIGYTSLSETNAPLIERITIKNKTTGLMMSSNTILMHFATLRQKQIFYSHYLNKMPLDPTKFGLETDNRIVIGENLTKKNAQLFKQAQILRKNNEIAQAYTEDGIVKIRLKKASKSRYTQSKTIAH